MVPGRKGEEALYNGGPGAQSTFKLPSWLCSPSSLMAHPRGGSSAQKLKESPHSGLLSAAQAHFEPSVASPGHRHPSVHAPSSSALPLWKRTSTAHEPSGHAPVFSFCSTVVNIHKIYYFKCTVHGIKYIHTVLQPSLFQIEIVPLKTNSIPLPFSLSPRSSHLPSTFCLCEFDYSWNLIQMKASGICPFGLTSFI